MQKPKKAGRAKTSDPLMRWPLGLKNNSQKNSREICSLNDRQKGKNVISFPFIIYGTVIIGTLIAI